MSWRLPAFLAATFAVKLIVLLQLQAQPLLQPDAGLDTTAYVDLARRVIAGDLGLGPGLYFLSPLYIYFLAGALALLNSMAFVRVVQIALGTAAVGCIFFTARRWFGERAGWIAAVLAALTGVFTFHEIVIMQSALDAFLAAAALMCLTRALAERDQPNRHAASRAAGLSGLFFGWQILNRPNIAIAVAGVLGSLAIVRRPRLALMLAAGALLGVAPVLARNAVVSHQFAPASSQGGLNFYIGNREGATGQYAAVPGVAANIEGQAHDTRKIAEKALGRPLSDGEVSSYFYGQGLAWIGAAPGRAIALFVRKLALVFNARHQWLDLSYPYYALDAGSWLWALFVGPWLLVPLGLAGIFVAPRGDRRAFFAWAAFIPCYAVSVAVFFVAERYRLPIFVPLCVTSAGAIDSALAALKPRFSSIKGR